jgi:hypothetical protein
MSFKLPPQVTRAGAPTATDDSAAGFIVGAIWINTSTSPRTGYTCTDDTPGAAAWELIGAPTTHPAYTSLGWSVSGHDGTTNSVAAFTSGGVSATVQASSDDQVLTRVGGNLVFTSFAGTIVFGPSVSSGYNAAYAPTGTTVTNAAGSAYYPIGTL